MKHIPSCVKEKYELLDVIGEGNKLSNTRFIKNSYKYFFFFFIYKNQKGSYGVVLKARKKVIEKKKNKKFEKTLIIYI